MYFNPRSPRGERHGDTLAIVNNSGFQSTLPSRGATCGNVCKIRRKSISIHAPLAGSDLRKCLQNSPQKYFNPRSPRGERLLGALECLNSLIFQSTLPSRGATIVCLHCAVKTSRFQSTLPSRGATKTTSKSSNTTAISIHAPLAGSDIKLSHGMGTVSYFNPRSPRGERLSSLSLVMNICYFNPRSPRGERHSASIIKIALLNFNPRSPRGERPGLSPPPPGVGHFNPRSPRGERQLPGEDKIMHDRFQSTLPSRGATLASAD